MNLSSRALNRLRELASVLIGRNRLSQARRQCYPQNLRNDSAQAILEQLEPRVMLSATYTVDTLQDVIADDGLTSLREAVIAANENEGADTIDFDQAALQAEAGEGNPLVITLDNPEGQLSITDDLTVTGLGDDILTIDADDNYRIFNITGDEVELQTVTVEISGLTLTGGLADNGGAIYADSLTDLTVSESTIVENTATADGGGIYALGALKINNSLILSNSAGENGGGIYGNSLSSLDITDSTIQLNSAESDGGGIYALGTLDIENSQILSNSAGENGGGICGYGLGSLAISESTIKLNSAENNGGGVYCMGSIRADIANTDIEQNSAGENGGGIYGIDIFDTNISESIIKQNSADGHGGGIYVEGDISILDIDKAQILGNTAGGYGGGLYTNTVGSMTTSIVVGNVSDSMGGGVVCYKDATFEMDSCTITFNEAKKYYGGIFVYAGFKKASYSSILEIFNLPTKTYPVEAKASITNSIISLNKAAHSGNMYKKGLTKTNLISTDPLFFANPDKGADGVWGTEDDYYGNLRLQFKSKGLNKSTATDGTDIAGNPRVFGPAADYGAYETDQLLVNDANLLAAINNHLGQAADMPVTITQVSEMTGDLDASNYGITDLTGLQAATSLSSIDLSYNPITTLAPIMDAGFSDTLDLNVSYTSLTKQAREEEIPALELLIGDIDYTGFMGAAYGRNKFTFYDAADHNDDEAVDNDKITFKITRDGMCMVIFEEDGYEFNANGDIVGTPAKINLIDTDSKSKLSISVKADKNTGDGMVTLSELNSENILKSISGKAVNFENGEINLNTAGEDAAKHSVTITLSEVKDAKINANNFGIKKLTVAKWTDSDDPTYSEEDGELQNPESFDISAEWVGKIDVKGRKDNRLTAGDDPLRGDFQADIDIDGAYSRDISLKYLNVKGLLDSSTITTSEDGSVYKVTAGEISDTSISTHHMNSIQAKGVKGDDDIDGDIDIDLIFSGVSNGGYEIRQVKAKDQLTTNIDQAVVAEGEDEIASGLIHKIEANTIVNSDVTASRIKMISAKTDIENSNFNLEGADSGGYSLQTLKTKGDITNTTFTADGAIKSISTTGDILNSTFTLAGVDKSNYSLPSMKSKGSVNGATINAAGGINKIQVDGDAMFNEITAAWITYLEAKGKVAETSGDVQIDSLDLDGWNSKGYSITKITSAGDFKGGRADLDEAKTWEINGAIDKITAEGDECSIVEATVYGNVNTIEFGGVSGMDMLVYGHFELFDVAGNFNGLYATPDGTEQGSLEIKGKLTKFQVGQLCSNVDVLASGQASEIERFYVGGLHDSSVYSENLLHSVKVLGWDDSVDDAIFLSGSTFQADAFTGITLTNWKLNPENTTEAAGPFIIIEDEANIGYLKYIDTQDGDNNFTWKPTKDWPAEAPAKDTVITQPV